MPQNRRRELSGGLMLLLYQVFGVIGIDNIPPVTLGCVGLQFAIFLRAFGVFELPWHDASQVCISANNVWKKKELYRLVYGALEHGDDWHLYYNMVSLLVKGQSLERRYGSMKFFYILSSFTVLTSAVLVALNVLAEEYLDIDGSACSIGFSGVIFALKVLTTYHDSNYMTRIMGIPILVPAKYAVWVELVMIQMIVPNVSFFGHLAGILVGMAYIKGPLKYILDLLYSAITRSYMPMSQPRFTQTSQRSGYAGGGDIYNRFVPPDMSEEEQLRRAMEESMQGSYSHNSNSVPPYPRFQDSGNSVPPYPRFQDSGNSAPPPPGFVFGDNYHQPPPPPVGFSPDIEELRNRRNARFTSH